jgi:hypothetical protein
LASEIDRYLFVNVSVGLNEFSLLGPLDSRAASPSRIRAARPVFKPVPPDNRFTLAAFKPGPDGTPSATFFAGPGKVVVRGMANAPKSRRFIKTVSRDVTGQGPIKLGVSLTPLGKRRLQKDRKLKVKVTVAYTPSGGLERRKSTWVTFKLKPKKKSS